MPDEKVYACTHVFLGTRPVLYVCREDGDLIFACGSEDHEQSIDDWKVVHRGHLLDVDASLTAIPDLANNEQAERALVGDTWKTGLITD